MRTSGRTIVAILLLNVFALAFISWQGQVPLPLVLLGEIGISTTSGMLGWAIGRDEPA